MRNTRMGCLCRIRVNGMSKVEGLRVNMRCRLMDLGLLLLMSGSFVVRLLLITCRFDWMVLLRLVLVGRDVLIGRLGLMEGRVLMIMRLGSGNRVNKLNVIGLMVSRDFRECRVMGNLHLVDSWVMGCCSWTVTTVRSTYEWMKGSSTTMGHVGYLVRPGD